MKVFVVTCSYNVSQTLVDGAFKSQAAAVTYAVGLNADKAKAVARFKDLIALRVSEAMVKFLDEDAMVQFEVIEAELK